MRIEGLPPQMPSNTPVTPFEIRRSILIFWVFMIIWLAGIFVWANVPTVPDPDAQWMFGGYGLRTVDSTSLSFKISAIVRLIGIVGTAISLGYYSYLVSNRRFGYWLTGLLALWAPVPAIVGYFLVWWKFKSN